MNNSIRVKKVKSMKQLRKDMMKLLEYYLPGNNTNKEIAINTECDMYYNGTIRSGFTHIHVVLRGGTYRQTLMNCLFKEYFGKECCSVFKPM
jgi:hypothetical protein